MLARPEHPMEAPVSPAQDQLIAEKPARASTTQVFLYGLTIFASAFLLFQVQPLIAKIILPWFGGVAAVWTVCLLFFQVVLLLGYLYAHMLTRNLRPAMQGRVHVALLAASLLALPILPKDSWKPSGVGDPALHILLVLAVTVGLPYFLLSSTSPLLQAWYTQSRVGAAPYRFYALSNAGSMLALLSYPTVVEPRISSRHQAVGWSLAYATVAVLFATIALSDRRETAAPRAQEAAPRPGWSTQLLWVALAACGSALLLAVTNYISLNIASVPFLWVIPLSLYLLSFILCFESHRWYRRGLFLRLLGVALGGMTYALSMQFANAPLVVLIPLFCVGLFICCMFCHGELARLKPHPAHLTSFYLMCSLGGALGAVFVALLAPRLFSGLDELPIAMGFCAILILVVLRRDPDSPFYRARLEPTWLGLVALSATLIVSLSMIVQEPAAGTRVMVRNFYGVLRVIDKVSPSLLHDTTQNPDVSDPHYRELLNGTIKHGMQFLAPVLRRLPTSYYGPDSGIGVTLAAMGRRGPLRVGVIGLGAGTIAVYGRPGDHYTFYEINPLVVEIANHEFTYLRESRAKVDVTLGDARLSLEREPPQQFDVLAVDAFSSDSIPVHLLTREVFALYFRHLKPDGVLAVHISNKYLDLQPVVQAAATLLKKDAMLVQNAGDDERGVSVSKWILVGSGQDFFHQPAVEQAGSLLPPAGQQQLWTDDYSSVFRLLK